MTSRLREAARRLARTPLFTSVAVLSVGVGVGLATSVFAVAHAVFFTPQQYRDPDRLVQIWQTQRPGSHQRSDYLVPERMMGWVGVPMRHVMGVAGYGMSSDQVLEGGSGPSRVGVQPIVGDWFGTLGTPALIGRVLTGEDNRPGAEPAAVVSWALWRQRLGGDSGVLGRVVHLSGAAYTVVGVMPRAFTRTETVWIPDASLPVGRRPVAYLGVARLRPGATAQQARDEIEERAAAQVEENPARWGGFGATAVPMTEVTTGGNRAALWTLAGVVGAVLLIGLSNLTTLFLVRAQERSVTLAVRAALGASSWQLGSGLLAEAVVVALGGSALGVLFALWGRGLAASMVFGGSGSPPELGVASLLIAVALAVLVTVVVGLEPLRRVRNLDVQRFLQRRAAGVGSTPTERRSRNVMVGVQVSVCVVLVAVLGVFAAAYRAYVAIDPGYDARRLVRVGLDWEASGIDEAAQWALARQVAERVRHDPAVSGVALWHLMLGAWPPQPRYQAVIDGAADGQASVGWRYLVEPGFFEGIGVALLQGRSFTEADDAGSAPVVIVSKDGADAWWPEGNPLGRRIKFGQDQPWMTVVGVVASTRPIGRVGRGFTLIARLQKRSVPSVFVPARQWRTIPPGWRLDSDCEECQGVSIAVRAAGDVPEAVRALRAGLRTVTPDLPLNFLTTIFDQQMSSSYDARQFVPQGRLAAAGSLVGLLLAVLGIVGVVADGVVSRTREIGLRMALGAPAARVLFAVVRESLTTGLAGLGAGLAVLVLLNDVISKRVVDMQIRMLTPKLTDPRLLAAAALVVLTLIVLAALVTARRALRVDPADALRSE